MPRRHSPVGRALGWCLALVFYADGALATTVRGNTDFPGSGKPNIRGYRQVSLAHIDTEITRAEQAEQRGLLTQAFKSPRIVQCVALAV